MNHIERTDAETGINSLSNSRLRVVERRRQNHQNSEAAANLFFIAQDRIEVNQIDSDGDEDNTPIISCNDCNNIFTSEERVLQHNRSCSDEQKMMDLKSKAVRRAIGLVQSNDIILTASNSGALVENMDVSDVEFHLQKWGGREGLSCVKHLF